MNRSTLYYMGMILFFPALLCAQSTLEVPYPPVPMGSLAYLDVRNGFRDATFGNIGNQMKSFSIERCQQPVRGKSAYSTLQATDLGRGQTSHARFELYKSNLDRVGIPGCDSGNDSVHDSVTRCTGGTFEEQNLPPIIATPHRKSGFARFLTLGSAVMSTTACRPRFDGGFAPGPRGTNFHVRPRTIIMCCKRKKAKMTGILNLLPHTVSDMRKAWRYSKKYGKILGATRYGMALSGFGIGCGQCSAHS